MVLDHQDVNDVLTDILKRLDKIEQEIGIKPVDGTIEAAIAQLGVSAQEFQNTLLQMTQSYNCAKGNYSIAEGYNSIANESYSHAEGKMSTAENIKYRFKNGEYITKEDWSWLDNDDINE